MAQNKNQCTNKTDYRSARKQITKIIEMKTYNVRDITHSAMLIALSFYICAWDIIKICLKQTNQDFNQKYL